MVKCAVTNCKNDSRRQTKKNNDISYHRFPKNQEETKKWVVAIKRPDWEPNIRSFVCSVHFSSSSIIETKSGLRKLVDGAVPELLIEDPLATSSSAEIVVPTSLIDLQIQKKIEKDNEDSLQTRNLKKQIAYLKEIAQRRRKRCNALYAQRKRLKKRILSLTQTIKELRGETPASNDIIIEVSSPSASESSI